MAEKPPILVPDLALPLPGEQVAITRKNNIKEAGAARWTGTEWAFKVSYENGEQAWVVQNSTDIGEGWREIPEPERLAAPAGGTDGPLS